MFREQWEDVGTGIRFGDYVSSGRNWFASMVVENFGSAVGGAITGVAYNEAAVVDNLHPDAGVYNVGEGVGGLTIRAVRESDGLTFTTTTGPSGGYSLYADPGTYTVTASGGVLGRGVVTRTGVPHPMTNGFVNTKVDFETGSAVTLDRLTIDGTAAADVITVRPMPGDPSSLEVVMNSQSQSYANDTVTDIVVNGLGGNDRLILEAGVFHDVILDGGEGSDIAEFTTGAGAQTVLLRSTMTQMIGGNYDVTVRNTEQTKAHGDASDTARFYDSNGDDRFYGRPTYSYLTGAGFTNYAFDFGRAYGNASAGGTDRAYLYDSTGDDRFYGRPTYSYITGSQFFNQANGFDFVYAYATAGGVDRAYLYDSAGDDRFYGRPTYSYMNGAGFYNFASRFDYVYAYATAGGLDRAYFYDSAGDDRFYGRPTYSYATGPGYFNYASSFDYVFAYATAGGVDRAWLYDSAAADAFFAQADVGRLSGTGFYNYTKGYDFVNAIANAGGVDTFTRINPLSYTLSKIGDWEL
jgi:hypothetical protein